MTGGCAATTRAVVTRADGESRIEQVPLDQPRSGEVVLRLEACGLCGTDLFKIDQRRESSERSPSPSVVLGHELVGVVEEAGESGFEVGERLVVTHHVPCGQCRLCAAGAETSCDAYRENLLVPGGFSERILVRSRAVANSAFPVPKGMDVAKAIFLEPAACVIRGITKADLLINSSVNNARLNNPRVLIFGSGSMGLLHLLVLRALFGDPYVAMVDPDADRRSMAKKLGASASHSGGEELIDVEGTSSFDAAFDTVGAQSIFAPALSSLRGGGSLILFAHGSALQENSFDANDFFKAERRILATYSSGRADQIKAYELISRGQLDASVLVTHRLALADFDQAVQLCRDRQALKVLLTP